MKKKLILNLLLLQLLMLSIHAQVKTVTDSALRNNTGKTWAVIIGISNYKNISGLNYADKDAQAFYDYLVNTDGGPKIEATQVRLLLNESAVSTEIYGALDWLSGSVKEHDRVIFYFSGHGDVEKKTIYQNGFLLAYNSPSAAYMISGTISINYLQEYLETYIATNKAKDVILVVDACRSGKLAGGSEGLKLTMNVLGKNWNGRVVKILSAQENELSLEGTKWGGGRGVFSYYLIKGLEGMANRNNDNNINTAELADYLHFSVADATGNVQNPEIDGDPKQELFTFDQKLLRKAAQDEITSQQTPLNMAIDAGNELEPDVKSDYIKYLGYVSKGQLIWGADERDTLNCARQIYLLLINKPGAESIKATLKSSFLAALQRKSQEVLDDYVKNGQVKSDTYEAYKEIAYAKTLVPPNYVLYNYIMARACFLGSIYSKDKAVAHQLLKQTLEYEEDAPYALSQLGIDFKSMDSSLYYDRRAIASAPQWAVPYNNIGVIYEISKKYETANVFFEKSIQLNPESATPYFNMAFLSDSLKNYDNAMGYYQKAIQLDPKLAEAYYQLGADCEIKKDYERALANYQKALQLDSTAENVKSIYSNFGVIYKEFKAYDKAIANCRKALQLDSAYVPAYCTLGTIYQALQDYNKSLTYYQKAIKFNATYAISYFDLGTLFQAQQAYGKAIGYYQEAIKRDSTMAGAYYNLGVIYQILKNYKKSISFCQMAIKQDATVASYYSLMGYCYVCEKNYKVGIPILQKVLNLNTEDFTGYYNLACAYSLAGDLNKSISYLKQTLDKGYHDYDQIQQDGDLINLRTTPGFAAIMKQYFPEKVK